jgi:hypothetical protein
VADLKIERAAATRNALERAQARARARDAALAEAVAAIDARRHSWPETAERAAAQQRLGEAVSLAQASGLSLGVIAERAGLELRALRKWLRPRREPAPSKSPTARLRPRR